MSQFLFDTNHLSPLVTIGHPLRETIYRRLDAGDSFALATPVLSELLFGIRSVPRATQNLKQWHLLRKYFAIYDITEHIAEEAAELRLNLRRCGWQLNIIDSFVAIIALHNNQILLTTDADFQGVPGLLQENWRT